MKLVKYNRFCTWQCKGRANPGPLLYILVHTYETPHYAGFSSLLSLRFSLVQIFSSAPCSHIPSLYAPNSISKAKFHTHTETQVNLVLFNCNFPNSISKAKFHTHTEPQVNLVLFNCNFYIFSQQTRRRKDSFTENQPVAKLLSTHRTTQTA
jgi:hypothetical protein